MRFFKQVYVGEKLVLLCLPEIFSFFFGKGCHIDREGKHVRKLSK